MSNGIEARRGIRMWRLLVAVALGWMAGAVASPLPATTHDLGTLPAELVRPFGVPLIREVIGGENGGRELALAADIDDDGSEYPVTAWWTRRPGQHTWSFLRPGSLLAAERARPETIYFIDDYGILRRSTDGGETWKRRSEVPGGGPTKLLAAERPGVLYLTTFDEFNGSFGFFRSTNGGLT